VNVSGCYVDAQTVPASFASIHRRIGEPSVPRISEFFGIVISMYYNDHEPPHFHAGYAEHEAVVTISSLDVLQGYLPSRCWSLVLD
jgi:hypothetical protein